MKPDIKWISFRLDRASRMLNPLIPNDDGKTFSAYNVPLNDGMPAYIEKAAYDKAVAALKLILSDEHCDWITNGGIKAAEDVLKELGEA